LSHGIFPFWTNCWPYKYHGQQLPFLTKGVLLNGGKDNIRYKRYLQEKGVLYTKLAPDHAKTRGPNSRHQVITDVDISEKRLEMLGSKYGMSDDYIYSYKIVNQQENAYIATHEIELIESIIAEQAFEIDSAIQNTNTRYLNNSFLAKNNRRFILLPFLGKVNDKYIEPVVIANIYEVGIITLQFVIPLENSSEFELTSKPPTSIKFDVIEFYEKKATYTVNDFWGKVERKNITLVDIYSYYKEYLETITEKSFIGNFDYTQKAWIIADVNFSQFKEHHIWVNENKNILTGYLKNAVDQVIDRTMEEDINSFLEESIVSRSKEHHFYCTTHSTLLCFGSEFVASNVNDSLESIKDELIKNNIYDLERISLSKKLLIEAMFEFLRFYELTFIKKFYATKILEDLSKGTYNTLAEYNHVRKELNFLLINYDDHLMFQADGSPKELYNKLLDKTGTELIQKKIQELVKNIRDDVNLNRETVIKERDMLTTLLTSSLTVTFGYVGIKSITENVLTTIPWGVGNIVKFQTGEVSIVLWVILLIIIISLNIYKFFPYKNR
jgi:hypothetical protein